MTTTTTIRRDTAAETLAALRARMSDESGGVSASQMAALSAEVRRWLDELEPAPLSPDMRIRAAIALLEHGSRGRGEATATLREALAEATCLA